MRHMACLVGNCSITNMHTKNLAIVWAPNLLRSQQSKSACVSGRAAFMEVQTQSAVVEFILNHTDVLFCSKSTSDIGDGAGHSSLSGPSLWGCLLPQSCSHWRRHRHRHEATAALPLFFLEVEEGPAALQGQFHTVIDFPPER
ncbi:rho GTPase-activating protein 32-like [Numida meleagris]|uniref:rho GTPase-activating protein 32-like n=1 Tax=Numida meleagris TaxID=8996 RepID=UPI000B3E246C|nr:rho GTPase-activating protein 32-like [Numida meleagris]